MFRSSIRHGHGDAEETERAGRCGCQYEVWHTGACLLRSVESILDQHHFDRNVSNCADVNYKGPWDGPVSRRGVLSLRCCWGTSKGLITNGDCLAAGDSLSIVVHRLRATEETPDHSTDLAEHARLYSVERTRPYSDGAADPGAGRLVEGKTVSIDCDHVEPTQHCDPWCGEITVRSMTSI